MIIGGVGLLCTRYLRQDLTTAVPRDVRDATRTDGLVAARWKQLRKCTVVLLALAHMVRCRRRHSSDPSSHEPAVCFGFGAVQALLLLHPFETFVLVCCVHRGTGWWLHTSFGLQSPKLSSTMDGAAARSCTIGFCSPAEQQQSAHAPSRFATDADYRNDSTYVLMVRVDQSDVPGPKTS
jgi:hypothetical protein